MAQDFLVEAWKQQLDAGLRAMEAVIEGATRLREMQLEAAAEAHADAEATRKAALAATDAAQLMKLQGDWVHANLRRAAAYGRGLVDIAAQTQAELVRCAWTPLPAAQALETPKSALLGMIDEAYKQWLGATQQFYQSTAEKKVNA